jgi:NADPH:quinone reductase-like Zn-dependent oxidoreductase
MRAVRYDRFGGIDVLEVRDVDPPVPGPDEVLVTVRAAGINPGESKIREGAYAERWPSTFPSGQGSDLAGVVEELGPGVTGWAPGDEVVGWVDDRSSQAELVAVPIGQLVRKPDGLPWEQAGALHVVGATAWAAVEAVDAGEGDVVVVSGAAGGVGSLTVQLAAARGARVIGLAGPANHEWLTAHGVLPVAYGDGVEERIRAAAPDGVDAFIDTHGDGYVDLALALGVATERIDTITDFAAAQRTGVRTDGNAVGARPGVIAELAARLADGRLEMPVAATYPLDRVRDAYRELERGHVRGKIVLVP